MRVLVAGDRGYIRAVLVHVGLPRRQRSAPYYAFGADTGQESR